MIREYPISECSAYPPCYADTQENIHLCDYHSGRLNWQIEYNLLESLYKDFVLFYNNIKQKYKQAIEDKDIRGQDYYFQVIRTFEKHVFPILRNRIKLYNLGSGLNI